MVTRTRATILLLLAAVLFAVAAAAAASGEDRRRETSLRRCLQRCEEDRPPYERARCVQECKEQQQQQQERRREHGRYDDDRRDRDRRGEGSSEEDEGRERGSRRRPYVFGRRSFRQVVRSDQGSVRLLPPFHQASRLLRGIKNYRVAVLEANPRSFVVPTHTDAHCICYVAQGEGVVATIEHGEQRSYAIRQGDVFVAPAGTINYLANTDGRRKLIVTKILHTISVPGKIQFFFGPGGRNPESFLSSFSKGVQRAAFKISEERLEKLLGKQDKGVIIRASEEQVRELRRHASEGSHGPHWPLPPFGESSRGPFNILEQRPRFANRHGRLYEADARSFHDLAEHDIRVAVVNITAGSMNAPFYNTRSVKVAYVLDGEGEAEIVCPHLSRGGRGGESEERRRERSKGKWREEEEEEQEGQEEEEEQVGQGYETIRARLSRGTVFVVPSGHPIVVTSSPRQHPPDRLLRRPRRQQREDVPRRDEQRAEEAGPAGQGAGVRGEREGGRRAAQRTAGVGVPRRPGAERPPRRGVGVGGRRAPPPQPPRARRRGGGDSPEDGSRCGVTRSAATSGVASA